MEISIVRTECPHCLAEGVSKPMVWRPYAYWFPGTGVIVPGAQFYCERCEAIAFVQFPIQLHEDSPDDWPF